MQEYKPFLELFFKIVQNETVILQGELNTDFSLERKFEEKLYLHTNNSKIPNTIRMFEYGNQVFLLYYWLSSSKDEFGRNIGNHPILGVSCSKRIFKKNPDMLALKLQNFFLSIIEEVNVNDINDSCEINNYFFNMYYDKQELYYHLKNILLNYSDNNNKLVYNDLLTFVRKQKLNVFSSIDVDEMITLKNPLKENSKNRIIK